MRSLPYRPDLTAEEAYVWALQESDSLAKRDIDTFTNSLSEQGWNHGRILCSVRLNERRIPWTVYPRSSTLFGEVKTLNHRLKSAHVSLFH